LGDFFLWLIYFKPPFWGVEGLKSRNWEVE
jgi:hypothetical protein